MGTTQTSLFATRFCRYFVSDFISALKHDIKWEIFYDLSFDRNINGTQKNINVTNEKAVSLLFTKTYGDEKVHPTGFEPVTTGSVD